MAKQGIDVIDAVVCSNKEDNQKKKATKTTMGSGNILEAPAHASSQQKKVRCGEYKKKGKIKDAEVQEQAF